MRAILSFLKNFDRGIGPFCHPRIPREEKVSPSFQSSPRRHSLCLRPPVRPPPLNHPPPVSSNLFWCGCLVIKPFSPPLGTHQRWLYANTFPVAFSVPEWCSILTRPFVILSQYEWTVAHFSPTLPPRRLSLEKSSRLIHHKGTSYFLRRD